MENIEHLQLRTYNAILACQIVGQCGKGIKSSEISNYQKKLGLPKP